MPVWYYVAPKAPVNGGYVLSRDLDLVNLRDKGFNVCTAQMYPAKVARRTEFSTGLASLGPSHVLWFWMHVSRKHIFFFSNFHTVSALSRNYMLFMVPRRLKSRPSHGRKHVRFRDDYTTLDYTSSYYRFHFFSFLFKHDVTTYNLSFC